MNFKENESATKLRGGYYTPPEIASYLLRWVMETHPKDILEPSCGDGVFLKELGELAKKPNSMNSVLAFEIEEAEANKARRAIKKLPGIKSRVNMADFLGWAFTQFDTDTGFDAVVGNPPFIRYQYMDDELQEHSNNIFDYFFLPYTKHTNAWVPFILSSMALLRPGGRVAMVVPSEILHVTHARSLRAFLTEECSKILIIDPEEIWFKGTLQGVVLLMAEKKQTPDSRSHGVSIIPTKNNSYLENNANTVFHNAEYVNGETIYGKWMKALLNHQERELFNNISEIDSVKTFNDIAEVDVGLVTGANKFFLVTDETVKEYALEKWAHPMFGRSEHAPGVIYNKATHNNNRENGLPTNFIWFNGDSFDALNKKAQEYILRGEKDELHKRYKCRIREPWFSVPYVYSTTVGMLKRCHNYPRLILNEVGAYTTDTAYRIRTRIPDKKFVFAFVNSLTALSAELEGRHYGGGVLELVPSEIERLMIPLPSKLSIKLSHLDKSIRSNKDASELLTEQDNYILEEVGLTKSDRHILHQAWIKLKNRRQRK